jgi:hypothetical protein
MWVPITLNELHHTIANAETAMDAALQPIWQAIPVEPMKWKLHPWGDAGGGFWVVAIFGGHVLWFNDIEWGFNLSRYREWGTIGEYRCNEDELQDMMKDVRDILMTGRSPEASGHRSPSRRSTRATYDSLQPARRYGPCDPNAARLRPGRRMLIRYAARTHSSREARRRTN